MSVGPSIQRRASRPAEAPCCWGKIIYYNTRGPTNDQSQSINLSQSDFFTGHNSKDYIAESTVWRFNEFRFNVQK